MSLIMFSTANRRANIPNIYAQTCSYQFHIPCRVIFKASDIFIRQNLKHKLNVQQSTEGTDLMRQVSEHKLNYFRQQIR